MTLTKLFDLKSGLNETRWQCCDKLIKTIHVRQRIASLSSCHCSIVIALWHYCHRVIAVSIHSAITPSSLHCRVIAPDRVTIIALSHYRHRVVASQHHRVTIIALSHNRHRIVVSSLHPIKPRLCSGVIENNMTPFILHTLLIQIGKFYQRDWKTYISRPSTYSCSLLVRLFQRKVLT